MRRSVVLGVVAAVLALAGVGAVGALSAESVAASPDALDRLASDFDAHADEVRVLALLSPT